MTTIADISQALGDYMLKGWVLTDQSCPTSGCVTPMLRSPRGRTPITTFCVKCSSEETQAPHLPKVPSSVSSEEHASRSSTPPTEFSPAPSSLIFEPPAESEETRQRREQSDRASSAIGKKLLQGWAMLGDECPAEKCYGVPLVRSPKFMGEKESRKECVICGNSYLTEVDWAGREKLVVQGSVKGAPVPLVSSATPLAQNRQPFSSPLNREVKSPDGPHPIQNSSSDTQISTIQSSPSAIIGVLDSTSRALQKSLLILSGRLTAISLDPSSIGITADAIGKVTQALAQVRELQRSELQTSRTT